MPLRSYRVVVTVLFMMIGTHPSFADRETTNSMACGGVEVRVQGAEFPDAFSIDYEVSFSDPIETYCLPVDMYRYGEVVDASVLELRQEAASWEKVEKLTQAIFFVRSPGHAVFGSQLDPSTQKVSLPHGLREHLVPAGRYRLFLRYRRAPCDGRKVTATCIAASSAFGLKASTTFLSTYCGPEADDVDEDDSVE